MKFERENPQLVRRRADLRASVARVLMMATASTAILYFPQAALAEGNCPVGQRPSGAEKVTNSTIDPALGYAAMGADANMFKADVGTYPADGNGGAFPNTGIGILTGTHNDGGFINQPAFPGDATPPGGGAAISAQANWLGYNGNDAGAPTKLWEQTVTGLTPVRLMPLPHIFPTRWSQRLRMSMWRRRSASAPVVREVAARVVCDSGSDVDSGTQFCVTEATADDWQPLGVTVTPTGTSVVLALHDAQIVSPNGNDFAMTVVSFRECAPFGPEIDVASTAITFPAYTLGGTATSQVITVRNTGTDPLIIGSITKTGTNATDFTIASDTCSGQTLAAATGTCAVTVNFLTGTAGTKTRDFPFRPTTATKIRWR